MLPPHAGSDQEPSTVPSFCQDPPRCPRRGLESENQIFLIINLINFIIMKAKQETKQETNFDEMPVLLGEYIKAMREAKRCREAVVRYLMEADAFDGLAEIVSDFSLLLKNP